MVPEGGGGGGGGGEEEEEEEYVCNYFTVRYEPVIGAAIFELIPFYFSRLL